MARICASSCLVREKRWKEMERVPPGSERYRRSGGGERLRGINSLQTTKRTGERNGGSKIGGGAKNEGRAVPESAKNRREKKLRRIKVRSPKFRPKKRHPTIQNGCEREK